MITFNLNPNSADELKKMIKVLRDEGLLGTEDKKTVKQQEAPVVTLPLGARAPRATQREMKAREEIDLARTELGQKPVNWRNLEERMAALAPYGINVGAPNESSEDGEDTGEGATFEGHIDLGHNPVD